MKMNIAKTKVNVFDNTSINVNNEKNQDKDIQRTINVSWGGMAKYWDLFKSNLDICLKRHGNSFVLPAMPLWCRYLHTHQTSTEQNGKEYAQHHIQGQKDQHMGRERTKVINIFSNVRKMKWTCVMDMAHQPSKRRPIDLACHHVATIRQEQKTRETSQTVER